MSKSSSYRLGLIPPDDGTYVFGCCAAHRKQASLIELELAARKHRWREMRELQLKFWQALMQDVTEMEEDMLAALKLPGIDEVRQSVATGDMTEGGQFIYTAQTARQLDRIVDEFLQRILGKYRPGKAFDDLDLPTLITYILQAFAVGVAYARKMIARALPESIDPSIIVNIMPDPEARYLKAMIAEAGKRITTELAVNNMDKVKLLLRQMAREGEWPIKIARMLHKEIGEGKAWYWQRIARTEATLANNAAYNAMAEANGVQYDQWSAAPTACPVCAAFQGEIWRHGEGPEPAQDTHPHCLCIRIPLFSHQERVRNRWDRGTPYGPGNGYTADEIERLIQERVSD